MEHRDNNQIKEQKIYFAMELAKQARENLEELYKLETGPRERKTIREAINTLEAVRDSLRPSRSLYAMLSEFKEVVNSVRSAFYNMGAKLNERRRPTTPHRDPV